MILDEASLVDAAAFATGLRGCVRSAVQSKHANHVVQKIIEVMPVSHASFVVDELKGVGQEVARHCFGCRVMCRILEHLSPSDSASPDSPLVKMTRERLEAGSTNVYAELIGAAERQVLTEVLRHVDGNMTQAAQRLGITRNTLRSKLSTLGIAIDRRVSVQRKGDA